LANYLMRATTMATRRFARTGPRPGTGRPGPRPEMWVSGTDPVEHKKYRVFIQQKNQAQWREEGWDISFAAWKDIWDQSGMWENRGRERGDYCMTRSDWSLPWTVDNAQIITRQEHARLQGDAVSSGWRSLAQKRYRQKNNLPATPVYHGKKKTK